jgi:Leucine-rich repeat (LRR) protein
MSDNDIAELANFPLMPHLTTIFLNNNRVAKLQKGLANSLPNLETLILTNNRVNVRFVIIL